MIDFSNRHLFTPYTHPESGITSYILTHRVAPVQQSFYFVNESMSADERYLWFYCAFPPSGNAAQGRTLGVVDFETGEMKHFPDTQFQHASPFVDPESGTVYWTASDTIWQRTPDANDSAQFVNTLPEEVVKNRTVPRLATHLTRSADGKTFFVDAKVGVQYIHGTLPLDGGDFDFWQHYDRNYNHAQFSPTDPELVLFAQENHSDPITGLRFGIEDRMHLIRHGERSRPVFVSPTRVSHEWWDADGKHVWCVGGHETWRTRIDDATVEKIEFPRHCWHSHCTKDARLLVGDSNQGFYRGCASTVHFMNRDDGKVSVLAEHKERPDYAGRNYHIDPHPRFCCNDRYVVFTTTVLGNIDVAIVPTDTLV